MTKITSPYLEAWRAKFKPAIPEPITRKSVLTGFDANVVIVREIFCNFCHEFICKFFGICAVFAFFHLVAKFSEPFLNYILYFFAFFV